MNLDVNTGTGKQQGFSLIELLVVIAIIAIMTALVAYNHRTTTAYSSIKAAGGELETAIREAQIWGTSAHPVPGLAPSDPERFDRGFGIFVSSNPAVQAQTRPKGNRGYTLYAGRGTGSVPNDDKRGPAALGLDIRSGEFTGGTRIVGICTGNGTPSACAPGAVKDLDILFRRPKNEAIIYDGNTRVEYAVIVLASPRDSAQTRSVVVLSSGVTYVVEE